MLTIPALPLSVDHRRGESATSLASRLARRNGVPRLITFCSDIGINYFALANGDNFEIRRLAAFAGHDPEMMLRNTPILIRKDWFMLKKAEIKFSAFQRTKPRICPMCLKKNGFLERRYSAHQTGYAQLQSVRVCIAHKCLLQELSKPTSNKDHFDIAQLALDHREQEPEIISKHSLGLERHMRKRLDGAGGRSWLDELPFHVATQTCENFGLLLLKGPDARRHLVTAHDWVTAGHIGFGFLKHGPDAMIDKLAALERGRPNDNSLYRARFKVFFEWLRNRDDDPSFDAIRDPIRTFIFETYPVPTGAQVLGVKNPKRRFHTHRTLSKERRLNFTKTGHALLQRGYVRKNDSNHFELLKYVPSDVADGVAHELNRVFTLTHTAKKLGITRAMLDQLIAHGFITNHFKHRAAIPGIHSDEIWRFAKSVTTNWQPYYRNEPAKKWVSFQGASKKCRCATWQVLAMVITHKIPVTNPHKSKKLLSDHLVCPKAISREFEHAEAEGVTLATVGQILGCSTDDARAKIKAGQLVETPAFARRAKAKLRTVTQQSVDILVREHA